MSFVPTTYVSGAGTRPCIGFFRYYPNGTSTVSTIEGPLKKYVSSLAYSATGLQTVTFTSDFTFVSGKTPAFLFKASFDALAQAFSVSQLGAFSTTLAIQQHSATTGIAVAANAAAFVEVFVYADTSAG